MMYIRGVGQVSPFTVEANNLQQQIDVQNEVVLRAIEPDYSTYIDQRQLRRMARIIKMSVAASGMAMKDAGIEKPDAIVTATGLGCIEDTQEFLRSLIADNETLLSPTAFIKSTHNTIGGQIALLLNSNGYNMTYAHRHFSWESALLDSQLLFQERETKYLLAGGIDELTDNSIHLLQRLGCIRMDADSKLPQGGEGAVFFVLSDEAHGNNYAQVVKTWFGYEEDISKAIATFFEDIGVRKEDIDLILTDNQKVISQLQDTSTVNYKRLCGEYHTSSAFATWLAAIILKQQRVPEWLAPIQPKKLENILIYNRSGNNGHSLILLSKC
jgi:3-oxoacyl-[acyl-carrier-protein] synthase II